MNDSEMQTAVEFAVDAAIPDTYSWDTDVFLRVLREQGFEVVPIKREPGDVD
jgi:hypothetical protein